jgi:hypothetical protein
MSHPKKPITKSWEEPGSIIYFYNGLWVDHQAHVSTLSSHANWRYPAGYEFPVPFGVPAFAS